MDKITSVLKNNNVKQSYFSLVFGTKIFANCFEFGFTEEKYLEFLRFIKNHDKWELVSKENIKVFYYYDLKLIAKNQGKLTLEKNITIKYYDFLNENNEGIRLINYKKIDNIDLNIFPGLDKIHDIRKMREIIFKKNDIYIKFLVVNHVNKEITFESIIYTSEKNKDNFIKEIPKFCKFFKLTKLTNYSVVEIEDIDKLSLSVL